MTTHLAGQIPRQGFTFVVRVLDGIDAGRDICRIHPDALAVLGVRVWEPVQIDNGGKTVASLAGNLDWSDRRDVAVIDSLAAGDLGVVTGDSLVITPVPAVAANAIWFENPDGVQLPADAIRASMLGKAVVAGSRESLLPQDYTRAYSHQAAASLSVLREQLGPMWQNTVLKVVETEPRGVVLVSSQTAIHFEGDVHVPAPTTGPDVRTKLSDIAGLDIQIAELRETVEMPFRHQALLRQLGVNAPHGVLIQGPPGSGKSEIVYAVAAEVGAPVTRLDGVDLEYRPAAKVADALKRALTPDGRNRVVLLDEIDRIAPAARDAQGAAAGSQLLKLLDDISRAPGIIVVATTSNPEACNPALFMPGRIDRRIEIPVPDRKAREDILRVHTRSLPLSPAVDLAAIAAKTPGFVGADLGRLCREAGMACASRVQTGELRVPQGGTPLVEVADFEAALAIVHPTAMTEGHVDTGDITWADVGDAEVTKRQLTETVLWPIRFPDNFQRLGISPPRGVLLYGPPGCGKTFLIRALANEAEANLISVKGAELLSKWVGESEAGVREVFRRARSAAPAIIFFDEIDAIAPRRGGSTDSGVTDRVVAQMLTEIDGVEPMNGVAVIGATNRPDLVDPALLRPGRMERHVFVDPPDAAARLEILRATCRKMPLDAAVDLESMASVTDGFSAADLAALAREAGFSAMYRDPAAALIMLVDFEDARTRVAPSIHAKTLDDLKRFAQEHGTSA